MCVIKNRIKELREARGMTLETLADLVGLSTSYVQRLENGDRNLSVKHFEGFAEALRVQPEDLIKSISERDRALLAAIHGSDRYHRPGYHAFHRTIGIRHAGRFIE